MDNETEPYVFRLYITGASPNSLRAVNNLKVFLEDYLEGQYELQVIRCIPAAPYC
jgi:circadian clock protein KaiB